MYDVSLILPCYNEEDNIRYVLKEAKYVLDGLRYEIIVVDNNSIDNSSYIARTEGVKVLYQPIQGYGASLRLGIKKAKGKWLLLCDCDSTYRLKDFKKFWEYRDYDVVIGNRLKYGRGMKPLHRYIGVPLLSFIGNRLYNRNIKDWHCGMRLVRKESIRGIKFTEDNFNFASEFIIKTDNLVYKQVDIHLRKPRYKRKPRLKTIPDGVKCLQYLVKEKLGRC